MFARDLKKGACGIGVNAYKYIKLNLKSFSGNGIKNLDNDRNT
jgi:hypothetical protein